MKVLDKLYISMADREATTNTGRKEIQRYFKIPKVIIKKKNKRELGRIYAPYLTPSTKIK